MNLIKTAKLKIIIQRTKLRVLPLIFGVFVALALPLFSSEKYYNDSLFACVESLHMPTILEYIWNNDEGPYFEEKERTQKVLDQLHEKLEESLEARIKTYTLEHVRYTDGASDDFHLIKGERLPQVIEMLRNSHKYWKKHLRNEHSLVFEDSIGGTGAYYWANLWEIEQLEIKLGGRMK
jgi:hypothetical protein